MFRRLPASALLPALALLIGSVFLTDSAQAQRDGEILDGIVAVVGNHPVLRSDVEALAFSLARGSSPTNSMRRSALEELITQHMVAEKAARDTTIQVSEDEVTQALQQRTAELVRQLGSEEAVERMYNRSIVQLQQDYRRDVRRQLLAQNLQRREFFNVRITPQEVRQWFARIPADSLPEIPEIVRLAHIVQFPAIEPEAREQARQQIDQIRQSILDGATIEEMAERYSDDPGSRNQGGRYSSINLRDLVPEFGAVAGTLEPGEISQVFETQFGFHVMRLNSRRGDILDFNHVLIQVDDSRTDATEALATLQMVRDSVVSAGASFGRLAREYSQEPGSAARAGNIVVPQSGERDLRFEALGADWRTTIDTLEVGEISRPTSVTLLDGRQAYHVVMLQRRVPTHLLSLEKDYALVEELALQEKRQIQFERWVDGLRREINVSCLDETLCRNINASASASR